MDPSKLKRKRESDEHNPTTKRLRKEQTTSTYLLRWVYEPCMNPDCNQGVAAQVWVDDFILDNKKLRDPLPCKVCRDKRWTPTQEQRVELHTRGISPYYWEIAKEMHDHLPVVDDLNLFTPPDLDTFDPNNPEVRTPMVTYKAACEKCNRAELTIKIILPEYPNIVQMFDDKICFDCKHNFSRAVDALRSAI